MKDNRYRVMEFTHSPNKDSSTGANSRRESNKDMALCCQFRQKYQNKCMMDNGWMAKDMDLENITILLRLITKEIGTKTKKKEEEYFNQTKVNTTVNGKMTKKMEKEC
jgi:hypothetical protein